MSSTQENEVYVASDKSLGLKECKVSSKSSASKNISDETVLVFDRGSYSSAATVVGTEIEDYPDADIVVDKHTSRALNIRGLQKVIIGISKPEVATEVCYENTTPINAEDGINEKNIEDAVKERLNGYPIVMGDILTVQANGKHFRFELVDATPSEGASYIKDTTNVLATVKTQDDEDTNGVEDLPVRTSTNANYSDLGGLDEEISQFKEMIERPLLDNDAFTGVETPTGVLLYGPPGTGKTELVKAGVNEAGVSFRMLTGSSVFQRYYGESEKKLRELFENAKENEPCVIFIDEFETVAPDSDKNQGKQTESRVSSQLKTLMDDISDDDNVLLIGATNEKESVDETFLRPGRFDRIMEIGVPDTQDRVNILEKLTSAMPLSFGEEFMEELGERTVGYTGADLEDLCMKANLNMQRRIESDYPQYSSVSEALDMESEGHSRVDFENAIEETRPTLLETYDVDIPDVGWADVGGHEDVIGQLKSKIEGPLQAPHLWSDQERSTGVLLYGPPGTGKTLLAKAMAGESNRTFIGVQSTELKSKWVGETERNIRRLFDLAQQLQPSIVYIDEIETIARDRSSMTQAEQSASAATSQLLSELDGMEDRGDVIVVGTTNADYDPNEPLEQQNVSFGLDKAMLRPGRLGQHYFIGKPNKEGRREVLDIHLSQVSENEFVVLGSIDREEIVERTEGFSGAEIEALCWRAKQKAREELLGSRRTYEDIKPHEVLYLTSSHLTSALDEVKESETSGEKEDDTDIENEDDSIVIADDIDEEDTR